LQTQIIVAEDHPIIRQCIRLIIDRDPDTILIGETANGQEVVTLAQELRPEIVIMDIMLPTINGIEATRQIHKLLPEIKVIAVSSHYEEIFLRNMLSAGASGYILKDTLYAELRPAMQKVINNEIYISQMLVNKYLQVSS
jgi:DNA-binding NarL/FixJ family response regulator